MLKHFMPYERQKAFEVQNKYRMIQQIYVFS